jgi:hypothetical protein
MSPAARVLAACAALAAAFVLALLIGSAGGEGDETAGTPEVEALNPPKGSMSAPKLEQTGSIPSLQSKPQPASTPSTGSGESATAPSSSGTAPSTGGGSSGGSSGGGSTPPPPPPG